MIAPLLETPRLTLRAPQALDLPVYTAYCASPRSHFVGGPFDAVKAFEKFAAMAGHWTLRGFGRYIMVQGDQPIGHVGPMKLDSAVDPEMTWTLWADEFEGQGFATEAAQAVLDHLVQECGWQHLIMRILPDNKKSCKIAERIGAVLSDEPAPAWYEGALTYRIGRFAA
jgi:RimJ/RimL family protein N-acetyltransferase